MSDAKEQFAVVNRNSGEFVSRVALTFEEALELLEAIDPAERGNLMVYKGWPRGVGSSSVLNSGSEDDHSDGPHIFDNGDNSPG